MRQPSYVLAPAVALLGLAGCGDPDLKGHYWSITATGVQNTCTDGPANASESFEYRVQYDVNEIVVAIGRDRVGTGYADGCQLVYETTMWTEERGGFEVTWRMRGSAIARYDGAGCTVPDGSDWFGTETFEIIHTDDPELTPGCTYVLELSGEYLEEVP